MGILSKAIAKTVSKGVKPKPKKPSNIMQEIIFLDTPNTVKNLFLKDTDMSRDIAGQLKNQELRAPSLRTLDTPTTSDAVPLDELNKVKKEVYNETQKLLEDYPEEITVYRAGKLNEEDGVSSFSLNPNYDVESSLPWQKKLNDPLLAYKVKKKDILASPDIAKKFGGGREFDESEIIIDNNKVIQSQDINKNKGGNIMGMQKQMEMFDLGGLKDQGETVDRKSRNKVPVGSLKKEVRDDVPINISEGEFVLPADVVRYHGLEKIMNLRQNAKSGLQLMDRMGQMGNSDQATLPDNIPFQPQNYQEGGAIVNPTIQMPQVQQQNQVPGVNFVQPQQLAMRPSVYSYAQPQPIQVTTPTVPTYTTMGAPQYQTPTSSAATPDYSKLVGASFGQMPKSETKRYFNKESGEEMYIPFIDGKPIYPIPAGFVEEAKAKAEEAAKDPTKSRVDTATVMGDTDSDSRTTPDTQEYKIASTLASEKGGTLSNLLDKMTSFGMVKIGKDILTSIKDKVSPRDERFGGLFPADAAQARGMYDKKDDINLLNTYAKEAGFVTYDDMAKNYGVKPTFKIGTEKGDVSPITGRTYNYAGQSEDKDGSIAYASFEDFKNAMKASAATGWYGGTMTKAEIESYTKPGGKNYDPKWDRRKIDAYNAMMNKTYPNRIVESEDVKKSTTTKNTLIDKSNKDPEGDIINVYKDPEVPDRIKGISKTMPSGVPDRITGTPITGTRTRTTLVDPKEFAKGKVGTTGKFTVGDPFVKGTITETLKKPGVIAPPRDSKRPSRKRGKGVALPNLQKQREDRERQKQREAEVKRAQGKRTTGFEQGYSMGDSISDSEPSTDSGMGGMGDVGYSTAVGGFIPKRKKKKVMKRGGLASRK